MTVTLITFLLSIFAACYAIPYGTWEFKNENKLGGVVVYIFSIVSIFVAGLGFFF